MTDEEWLAPEDGDEDIDVQAEVLASLAGLRKSLKLTQLEVARRMGTTQSAVSDLETGLGDPRLSTLQRYARALGVRISVDLMGV